MAPSHDEGGVSLKIRKNLGTEGGGRWEEDRIREREESGAVPGGVRKNWHIVFGVGKNDNGMVIALSEGNTLPVERRTSHPAKSVTCQGKS